MSNRDPLAAAHARIASLERQLADLHEKLGQLAEGELELQELFTAYSKPGLEQELEAREQRIEELEREVERALTSPREEVLAWYRAREAEIERKLAAAECRRPEREREIARIAGGELEPEIAERMLRQHSDERARRVRELTRVRKAIAALAPEEQAGLAFVGTRLEFSAPGITSLVRGRCRAGFTECGYWQDSYHDTKEAWLFRVGGAFVVRLDCLETKNYHEERREVFHFVSHDHGRSWEESPLRFYSWVNRAASSTHLSLWCSWSDDRGKTRQGRVVYDWTTDDDGRRQFISHDGGSTWDPVPPDELAGEAETWLRFMGRSQGLDAVRPEELIEGGGTLFHPGCLEGREALAHASLA